MEATPKAPDSDTQANGTAKTFDAGDGPMTRLLERRYPQVLRADTLAEIREQRRETECQERALRERRLREFRAEVGPRYHDATLDSFELVVEAQRAAMESIRRYCGQMSDRVAAGQGVVLLGPPGTGKDHLLVGLARVAILDVGLTVRAVDGVTLYSRLREAIATGRPESSVVNRLVCPPILLLSDPIPPAGSLTDYQRTVLFRVVDQRYRFLRPTWTTLNVGTGTEADERLGAPIVDRLRQGALVVRCDWPSYRRATG